jgi:hypothetical protein
VQGQEKREEHLMATNQIFLVMDAGTPVAAFTARRELQAHLRRMTQLIIDGCREGRLIVGNHECDDAADRMAPWGTREPPDLN